jgi:hypothetical protein
MKLDIFLPQTAFYPSGFWVKKTSQSEVISKKRKYVHPNAFSTNNEEFSCLGDLPQGGRFLLSKDRNCHQYLGLV